MGWSGGGEDGVAVCVVRGVVAGEFAADDRGGGGGDRGSARSGNVWVAVNNVEYESGNAAGVVLPAVDGFLSGNAEGCANMAFQVQRGVVSQAGKESVHGGEPCAAMLGESTLTASGRDAELQESRIVVGHDVEGVPGLASAVPAYPVALLHAVRKGRAHVPSGATDAVADAGAEPLWFQQDGTILGKPCPEPCLGGLGVAACARLADALTSRYTIRAWAAFVAGGAHHPVRNTIPQPLGFQENGPQAIETLTELARGCARIATRADAATTVPVPNLRWPRGDLVPLGAADAVRCTAP